MMLLRGFDRQSLPETILSRCIDDSPVHEGRPATGEPDEKKLVTFIAQQISR